MARVYYFSTILIGLFSFKLLIKLPIIDNVKSILLFFISFNAFAEYLVDYKHLAESGAIPEEELLFILKSPSRDNIQKEEMKVTRTIASEIQINEVIQFKNTPIELSVSKD